MYWYIKPEDICEKCCIRCSSFCDHWTLYACEITHAPEKDCKKCLKKIE
jgi:hypothetical protein